MSNKIDIGEDYISDELLQSVSVTQVYVGKIGFVQMSLKEKHRNQFLASVSGDEPSQFTSFIKDIHSLLSQAPHVMEISPRFDKKGNDKDVAEPRATMKLDGSSLQFYDFLNMRVVMPKHVRNEYFIGMENSFTPEEFSIYFDGGLFFVCAPSNKVPLWSDIGQVAREFITETVKQSSCFEIIDRFGPSPLHPEIYFIKTKYNEDCEDELRKGLPIIENVNDDLVVILPEEIPLPEMVEYFLHTVAIPLRYFYEARRIDSELFLARNELDNLNQQLSKELSEYFHIRPIQRYFSKTPANIRQLLSQMHLKMQNIASLESKFRKETSDAMQQIEKVSFLLSLKEYLADELTLSEEIDKNAQLTVMNFAADETSNFVVIQATMISAFVGAVIGGIIALAAQILFK